MAEVSVDDRIQRLYGQAEAQAESVFNAAVPINRYFRSLPSMSAMGDLKTKERQFEHAYLIQVRVEHFSIFEKLVFTITSRILRILLNI